VQVVGGRGEQGDRLADIAPGGGNPDLESGGQAGEGVAVAQVGQGEQGLPAGVESAPTGSSLVAVVRIRSARWFSDRVDSGIEAG
jgi:hypothetical protein